MPAHHLLRLSPWIVSVRAVDIILYSIALLVIAFVYFDYSV